ncbi:MAG: sulfotransferase [Alphaproteobacteria bacterium]|nr:MAG: sulfotransferase [Alphaproteobacteria bacterium]
MTPPPPAAPPGATPLLSGYRFVFLLTYGRSGSTVLNRVLNAIPGYLIRGENENALFHLFRYLQALRRARHDYLRRDAGPEHPWFGANGIRVRRIMAESLNGFLRHVLRPEPDSRVLGFKEIRHTRLAMSGPEFRAYAEFLLEAFPGARLVFNTRRWQDVARSGWWTQMPPERVREVLDDADARFAAMRDAHPDRCILMRYEDYAADPAALRPLFDFLGEPFDAAAIGALMAERLNHKVPVPGGRP